MPIRYELIVYWSTEDQSYIVEVPELPGCMADGATYQEAVANAEAVIGEWIQTARELGRPISEPKLRMHEGVAKSWSPDERGQDFWKRIPVEVSNHGKHSETDSIPPEIQ